MNILITGGAGTIGRSLVRVFYDTCNKIIIYSRDEHKHAAMKAEFPEYPDNKMRYMIGDVCDKERLTYALKDVDVCIHAAAMKHIDVCEYNPSESIRVNVGGSLNVAKACGINNVKCCMFLSTDKACNPISAYGSQKSVAEHMFIGFNNMFHGTLYNICRYGNVFGSEGSVINIWKFNNNCKPVSVTNIEMTRFFWSQEDAAKFIKIMIDNAIFHHERGCIYIPKMRAYKILDIAQSYSLDNVIVSDVRCPEKIHEELINETESKTTYYNNEQGLQYYIVYPHFHDWSNKILPRGKLFDMSSFSSKDYCYAQ